MDFRSVFNKMNESKIPPQIAYLVGLAAGIGLGYLIFDKGLFLAALGKMPQTQYVYVPTRCRDCEDKAKSGVVNNGESEAD